MKKGLLHWENAIQDKACLRFVKCHILHVYSRGNSPLQMKYAYKNTYFRINNIVSTYISKLTFFSFAFPVSRLMIVQEITPMAIPSEIL